MAKGLSALLSRYVTGRSRRQLPGKLAAELIRDLPERFHFRALGSSMEPAIRSGSDLVIAREPREQAAPGDVVMVLGDTGPIVHRVVASASGPLLWGDSRATPDGYVSQFEWIGRVVEVRPPTLFRRVAQLAARLRVIALSLRRRPSDQ